MVRPGPGVLIINVKRKEIVYIFASKNRNIKSPYQIKSNIKSDFWDGPPIKSI